MKIGKMQKNTFWGLLSQLTVLSLGLLIPRLVLVSYGSEINGLLNTVTQIFGYVALLEAGIGNAAINALYKPIVNKDKSRVSEVVSATRIYYKKVTIVYAVCVIVVSLVYPMLVISEICYISMALVIFFQGMSGALVFYFIAAYKQLLIADGKNYYNQTIYLIIYIITSMTKIILMSRGVDIVFLQFAYFVITICQIMIYRGVIKKKYFWIQYHKKPNMECLAQRNAFLVHEISIAVFSGTDVFLLSTFCSLKIASIYAIYNLVFSSLNALINAVNGSLTYVLGQTYAKDKKEYIKIHDTYEEIYMAVIFSLMTVAYILIIPFVKIYTSGVSDIQYIDYRLPFLFVMIQLLSCGRAISSNLINLAGHAKATQTRSIIETVINLTVSIVLIHYLGIYGVLIGTITALLYRSNDIVIYANKKILDRSSITTYKKWMKNLMIFFLFAIIEYVLRDKLFLMCVNILNFLWIAVILTTIVVIVYFSILFIGSVDHRTSIIKILRRRK